MTCSFMRSNVFSDVDIICTTCIHFITAHSRTLQFNPFNLTLSLSNSPLRHSENDHTKKKNEKKKMKNEK